MSINIVYNCNSVISYYPLSNIVYLLARLQKCAKFSSLDLKSGYHHIGLTPEAKQKRGLNTTSGKWYWNIDSFGIP